MGRKKASFEAELGDRTDDGMIEIRICVPRWFVNHAKKNGRTPEEQMLANFGTPKPNETEPERNAREFFYEACLKAWSK